MSLFIFGCLKLLFQLLPPYRYREYIMYFILHQKKGTHSGDILGRSIVQICNNMLSHIDAIKLDPMEFLLLVQCRSTGRVSDPCTRASSTVYVRMDKRDFDVIKNTLR